MKINFIEIDSSFVITEDWHFTVSNYALTNPIKNAFCTNIQDQKKNWICVAKAGTRFKLKRISLKGKYVSESTFFLSTKIAGKDSRLSVNKSDFNNIEIDKEVVIDMDFTYSIVSKGSSFKYCIPYSFNETSLNPARSSFTFSLYSGYSHSIVQGRHFDESVNVKSSKMQFSRSSDLSIEQSSNDYEDIKKKFDTIKKNSEYSCIYKTRTDEVKKLSRYDANYLQMIMSSELVESETNHFNKSKEIEDYLAQSSRYTINEKETLGLVSLVNKLEHEGKLYIKKGKK